MTVSVGAGAVVQVEYRRSHSCRRASGLCGARYWNLVLGARGPPSLQLVAARQANPKQQNKPLSGSTGRVPQHTGKIQQRTPMAVAVGTRLVRWYRSRSAVRTHGDAPPVVAVLAIGTVLRARRPSPPQLVPACRAKPSQTHDLQHGACAATYDGAKKKQKTPSWCGCTGLVAR